MWNIPVRIVPVSEETLAAVTQLGKEMIESSQFGYLGPDFDWDHSMRQTRWCMHEPHYYVRVAFDDKNIAVGFVAGHVIHFHFSPKLMGIEDAWYVRQATPERAKIGKALMMGFVKWALDEKQAVLVQSGDIAGIDSEAVWALYNHMGFKRFGSLYKYSRSAA